MRGTEMKRALVTFAALAFGAAAFLSHLPATRAAVGVCDPQQSRLCVGLIEWFNFEETSTNAIHRGSFVDTILLEPGATNGGGNCSGLWSGHALCLTNDVYVVRRWGSLPASGTVAFWVNQASGTQGGTQVVLRNWTPLTGGDAWAGGLQYGLIDGKPFIKAYEDETDISNVFTYGSAISASAWHLIVYKTSPFGPYGKAKACVSVDNGAFTCGDITYNTKPAVGADLFVGGVPYVTNASLDGLLIANRPWSPMDVAQYWNGGAGRAFPFY